MAVRLLQVFARTYKESGALVSDHVGARVQVVGEPSLPRAGQSCDDEAQGLPRRSACFHFEALDHLLVGLSGWDRFSDHRVEAGRTLVVHDLLYLWQCVLVLPPKARV